MSFPFYVRLSNISEKQIRNLPSLLKKSHKAVGQRSRTLHTLVVLGYPFCPTNLLASKKPVVAAANILSANQLIVTASIRQKSNTVFPTREPPSSRSLVENVSTVWVNNRHHFWIRFSHCSWPLIVAN